eukprot:jgi/Ulvmu1/188/UM001_0192.1
MVAVLWPPLCDNCRAQRHDESRSTFATCATFVRACCPRSWRSPHAHLEVYAYVRTQTDSTHAKVRHTLQAHIQSHVVWTPCLRDPDTVITSTRARGQGGCDQNLSLQTQMDAPCLPCPRAARLHRASSRHDATGIEIRSLVAAVRRMPAGSRLPEATLLDIVKRHAEHRMAMKHGGNQRQTLLKVIWAQVHHTADLKQVKEGVQMADSIRAYDDGCSPFPEATYLLYLSAVGKFNLGELSEAKKRAIQVLSMERHHTRAAILIHMIKNRSNRHRLGWLPWHKKA